MTLIKVPELPNGYTPRGRRRAFVRSYVEHGRKVRNCHLPPGPELSARCEEFTRLMKFLEAWIEYQEDCEAHG